MFKFNDLDTFVQYLFLLESYEEAGSTVKEYKSFYRHGKIVVEVES